MGAFFVDAKLPKNTTVSALVDTGATFSKIPSAILKRLKIKPDFTTKVEIGDGRVLRRKVGYVSVRLNGRTAKVPVMFGKRGEIPLIGATTLEILGLAPDPVRHKLVESPHYEV